jgi:excisionase family DNA binding protein
MDEYMTSTEAARALGVTSQAVYAMIRRGVFRQLRRRRGWQWLIARSEVEALIAMADEIVVIDDKEEGSR